MSCSISSKLTEVYSIQFSSQCGFSLVGFLGMIDRGMFYNLIQVVKFVFAVLKQLSCNLNRSEPLRIQPQITRDSQQITRDIAAFLNSLNM